jgi:hypothetical protein
MSLLFGFNLTGGKGRGKDPGEFLLSELAAHTSSRNICHLTAQAVSSSKPIKLPI